MKLDLSAAWDGAVRMLMGNRETLLVLGGVFFFLPYLAFALLLPEADSAGAMDSGGDYDAAMAAMQAIYAEYWWALALLAIVQTIGIIAVLAVLGDGSRPTVGAAIQRGLAYLLPQFGAQVLVLGVLAFASLLAALVGALIGGGPGGALVVAVVLVAPLAVFLIVRFSLVAPVIAIEKVGNPISALRRSWRLTAGNTLRLIGFFALLLIAFIVISSVLSLVAGLAIALLGDGAAVIAGAVISSLLNTIFALVAYAVLGSVHRQLVGGAAASVPRTASEN